MPADRGEIVEWMDRLRAAMFDAVTEADVREIVAGLVARAKEGDRAAVQLLFAQVIGPASLVTRRADADEPPAEERERIERATLRLRESKARRAAQ